MAEMDAWYVFAVDRVENHIEVSREDLALSASRWTWDALWQTPNGKTSCRRLGRSATIAPIGVGDIEDALCVVCRGLAGLHTGLLDDESAEPAGLARWRLHAIAVDAVNAWLGLRYALGPREQPF